MGIAAEYIADLLTPYEFECNLRSSGWPFLAISWSNHKTKGDRAFSVRAPQLWNDLPEEIREANTLGVFETTPYHGNSASYSMSVIL